MDDDLPAWAIQVACEQLGFDGLWEASDGDYQAIFDLAEDLADQED